MFLLLISTEHVHGGSRTAATYRMELFVINVNSFQPLTIITKRSNLDVPATLDPPLMFVQYSHKLIFPFFVVSFFR